MSTTNSEHSGAPGSRSWATLLIWGSLTLLVAATAVLVVEQVTTMQNAMGPMSGTMGLSWVDAALLAVADAYQWMPFKRMCLRHCRSPLAFLMHMAGIQGPVRGLRIGLRHGWFCLGCCWALMLALLALGLMNLALMAGFAVTIFVEKTWRYRMVFARVVGLALILLSAAIVVHPEIISSLFPNTGM